MLETRHLTFATPQRKKLIKEISLLFKPGFLYGILGPNGSGKSTFFKTLTKIWKPSSGQVLWKGQNLHAKTRKEMSQTISLVPQNAQVHFDFTVSEVVQMGRYSHATNTQEMINKALQMVDAYHLRNRPFTELSFGERQRVYIARSLITESPILLLDEPASSLDIRHQLEIWELLQLLAKQGKIIIVATHDIQGVKRFCDHAAIFNHGSCIAMGESVITETTLTEVFGVLEEDHVFVMAGQHG